MLIGRGFPKDADAGAELMEGLPFVQLDMVRQRDFQTYVKVLFAVDRERNAKGMIEVKI
jgi:hypothetical protein